MLHIAQSKLLICSNDAFIKVLNTLMYARWRNTVYNVTIKYLIKFGQTPLRLQWETCNWPYEWTQNSYHEPLWTWKYISLMFKGLNPVVKCMFLWVCLCVPSTLISFLIELPPPSQTLSGRVGLIACGWVTAYLSISKFIYSFLTSMPIMICLVNVYVCKKEKETD